MTQIVLTDQKTDGEGNVAATRCHCMKGCLRLVYYNGSPALETEAGLIVPEHASEEILTELGGPLAMARAARKLRA